MADQSDGNLAPKGKKGKLTNSQLRLLGFDPEEEGTPYSVDTCTNPSVSTLLPRIQNYGPTPESMFNTLPDLTSAQKKRLQQADAVRAIGKKLQEITDETDRATRRACAPSPPSWRVCAGAPSPRQTLRLPLPFCMGTTSPTHRGPTWKRRSILCAPR